MGGALVSWEGEALWPTIGPALASAVADLLVVVDHGGTIRYANRAAGGVASDRLIGSPLLEHLPAGLRAEFGAALAEIFAGRPGRSWEVPIALADGRRRWYATHVAPLLAAGRVLGATIVARDLSERHRAQAALRESDDRFRTLFEHAPEAIGVFDVDRVTFTDVNRRACMLFGLSREALLRESPITLSPAEQPCGQSSATLAWQHLAQALGGGAPEFDWVHLTAKGAAIDCVVRIVRLPESGRRLVRLSITDVTTQRRLEAQLRQWQGNAIGGGFVRESGAESRGARSVDVNATVRDAVAWLQRLVGTRIQLVADVATEIAPVLVDRDQLDQLLVNLVVNARDAMPAGGSITVSTTTLAAWSGTSDSGCRVTGPVVRLRVEDNGPGIDDQTRRRIFEPFFSTKLSGRAAGLGLSIVAGIVRQACGCIEVMSEVGAGTRFDIMLPADRSAMIPPTMQ